MLLVVLGVFYFSLPRDLFPDPASTVIEDREGKLLGARIADDGQWRFPEADSVPEKFGVALIHFEDQYFQYHPGVNPLATGRALLQNIRAGKIVSGGSTLSMQVIRLHRKGRPRHLAEKVAEMFLAIRLEVRHSKEKILRLYASHAPFGGNVVGLDAAAWRYFGRSAHELSWAEAATLAVLPNAPSLIYPGKNHELLLKKRNRLLERLREKGFMDSLSCRLACLEPLPLEPHPLPMQASHLLTRVARFRQGKKVRTTIDSYLQQRVFQIVDSHYQVLAGKQIHNAAVVVAHVATGEVLAYIGNTHNRQNPWQGHQVDVVTAPRSTGSILKPLLYALLMQEGKSLPNTLVPDIPTQIAGYSPKNYFMSYDGAVPASRSLSRSLNVPSVRMLRDYGVEKFHHELKKMGVSTLIYPPGHYGLSLILGGAEGSLWDVAGMYASMSRVLRNHPRHYGRYDPGDVRSLHFIEGEGRPEKNNLAVNDAGVFSAASVWLTYQALIEVNRPDEDSGWELFSSQGKVAWKTGTSFGGRDAWAVGSTPDYVVGVWVGNATGEGRAELTGLSAAAPIMFQVFDLLPASSWFEQPFGEMHQIAVCRQSGHRAGRHCPDQDTLWVHQAGLNTEACPYHIQVHLNQEGNARVSSHCEDVDNMVSASWFVLPPAMEWYYRRRNPSYRTLPPYRGDCITHDGLEVMEMIYPRENTAIFIPRQMDGTLGEAVFEVAHRQDHASIHWHLDGEYLGRTTHLHQMGLQPAEGFHTLTLVDDQGQVLVQEFEIAGSD